MVNMGQYRRLNKNFINFLELLLNEFLRYRILESFFVLDLLFLVLFLLSLIKNTHMQNLLLSQKLIKILITFLQKLP